MEQYKWLSLGLERMLSKHSLGTGLINKLSIDLERRGGIFSKLSFMWGCSSMVSRCWLKGNLWILTTY